MKFTLRLPLVFAWFGFVVSAFAQSPNDQAAALIEKNEFFAAERIVEPLTTVKKPDARSLYQLSQIRLAQQRTEDALKLVERAIKLDDRKPEFYSQLGKALAQRSAEAPGGMYYTKMRKAFEKSLALDPKHLPGLIGLTRFYTNAARHEGGDFKKAREYAAQLAAIDPLQGELEFGSIASRLGNKPTALKHYEKAVELAPTSTDALLYYGYALQGLDRRDEARAKFQAALKINPSLQSAKLAIQALDEPPPPPNLR